MPQANRLKLPSSSAKQQTENRALWNETRSADDADFFTLGYSGKKMDEIIRSLNSHGIRTLVDIRHNPVSMYRPELCKTNLARLLAERDIQYVHFPQLGVPRDIRARAIDTGSRDVIWKWYDENVVGPFLGRNLHVFLNGFEHPIALMCTEIDPHECHRHRLSLALEQMGMKNFDL
jgi:uncharacterized protein (DUF488 family)